jgi:hypothetical protein
VAEAIYISQDCLPPNWFSITEFRSCYYNSSGHPYVKFLGNNTPSNDENPDERIEQMRPFLLGNPRIFYYNHYALIQPTALHICNYMNADANMGQDDYVNCEFGGVTTDDFRALLRDLEEQNEIKHPVAILYNDSQALSQSVPGLFVIAISNKAGYASDQVTDVHEVSAIKRQDGLQFKFGYDRFTSYDNSLHEMQYNLSSRYQDSGLYIGTKRYNSGSYFTLMNFMGHLTYRNCPKQSDMAELELYKILMSKETWETFILPLVENPEEVTVLSLGDVPDSIMYNRIIVQARKLMTDRRAKLQGERSINQDNINAYIRSITECKIRMDSLQAELLSVDTQLARINADSLLAEIRAVKDLDYVTGLTFSNRCITVTTEPILVDGIVPIGGYEIQLHPWDSAIRITNTVNPKNGFDHPHVSGHNPCWGNYTDIYYHLSKFEFTVVMELLHNYLSSWNYEDLWGRNLVWWDAKYFFEFMTEMDYMDNLSYELDTYYTEVHSGEHMPQWLAVYCPDCGQYIPECTCSHEDEDIDPYATGEEDEPEDEEESSDEPGEHDS